MWIELRWPENPPSTYARYTETLDSSLTLLGHTRSVYRNLRNWRSIKRPQIAVPKLYNWAISSYRTQVTPNPQVMVIARPNNLNVSCKLFGYLAALLLWLVDLASLVCDMNWWLSCRVSALQSVVAWSISSCGDYGIHSWCDLIRSTSCPVFPYIVRRCSADFLVMVIQFTMSNLCRLFNAKAIPREEQ